MGAGLTWKSQHNYTCNSVAHSHQNLPGKGLSRGLLRDCEIFANLCISFVSSSNRQVLNNPSIKEKAVKLGSALSPWKEMVDPVSRAVWWVEHCAVLYCTALYCTVLQVGEARDHQPRGVEPQAVLQQDPRPHRQVDTSPAPAPMLSSCFVLQDSINQM